MKITGFFVDIQWLCFFLSPVFFCDTAKAQVIGIGALNTNGSSSSSVQTAVPFLTITPDSRSGAMGEAGVAISPDVNANYWNPAKLVFNGSDNDMAVSYSPWLRHLIPDISLSYAAYMHKFDDRNAIGASLRYFNLGTIELVDNVQNPLGTYQPNEFSLDGSYARKFGDGFSLGITLRYIQSGLANGTFAAGQQTYTARSVAADVSAYSKEPIEQFGGSGVFSFGMDISNIGSKISYSTYGTPYFLPTNLKVGIADLWHVDDVNDLTFTIDLNKLLVPSTIRDANGNVIDDQSNKSVIAGIFSSLNDAPGGVSGEFKEITFSPGVEYSYDKAFAIRAGYYYENPNNGGRQYLTLGSGLKFNDFKLDFSYILANQNQSPLANTLRFTLGYNFGR